MKPTKNNTKSTGGKPSEDVYDNWKEESDVDPENPDRKKPANEKPGSRNEKDFSEDHTGSDLDVPGAELDDQQESVGSEDEENNYYSLGGDAKNSLEENRSEAEMKEENKGKH